MVPDVNFLIAAERYAALVAVAGIGEKRQSVERYVELNEIVA